MVKNFNMKDINSFFDFFNRSKTEKHLNKREGEIKIGEKLSYLSTFDQLAHEDAQYVLIGVPEDIGILANYGKAGASDFWDDFLSAFINLQENRYLSGNDFIIAGNIKTNDLIQQAQKSIQDHKHQLGRLSVFVETLDEWLSKIIKKVKQNGKIPIVIGGGHNNAFGMIKGVSSAQKKSINVLNFDAHTDLRWIDYRHSGNSFSYAIDQNYLNQYTIFGLDKAYTPEYIYKFIDQNKKINCVFADEIYRRTNPEIIYKAKHEAEKLSEFGLEIDMDCVKHQPASALNPVGFFPQQLYAILQALAIDTISYVHFCEAVKSKKFGSGKLVANLVFSILQPE